MKTNFLESVNDTIREYESALKWLAEGEPDKDSPHVKQYEQHVKEIFGEDPGIERD